MQVSKRINLDTKLKGKAGGCRCVRLPGVHIKQKFLSSWERTVRAEVCSVKLPKKKEREDGKTHLEDHMV